MLLNEFSERGWTRGGLNYHLSKTDKTGSFHRQPDSGRERPERPTMLIRLNRWYAALGRTNIHFNDPGVKINGQYYRDVLLMQVLLPDFREITDNFIFQQDNAPAHRARETVE